MGESTLIVARPGRLRDALIALLTTIPRLKIIGQADNDASALRMVRERQPALILLDSTLPGEEVKAMISRIKANWPQTRCVALVDNPPQQQVAQIAGADEIVFKGYPSGNLLASIEKLLPRSER